MGWSAAGMCSGGCAPSPFVEALNTYATALDGRQWDLLDTVFAPDVYADYGSEVFLEGREAVKAMVSTVLTPCGPTQHLLGNYELRLNTGQPVLRCQVRAYHADADRARGLSYELLGRYVAVFEQVEEGWRIVRFKERATLELGTYQVLGGWPAAEVE